MLVILLENASKKEQQLLSYSSYVIISCYNSDKQNLAIHFPYEHELQKTYLFKQLKQLHHLRYSLTEEQFLLHLYFRDLSYLIRAIDLLRK